MTDHGQAAIDAGARAYDPEAWTAYDRESPSTEGRELMVEYSKSKAESILTAAEPHLRKKWAEEAETLMPEMGLHINVTPYREGVADGVNRVLRLLEGAGE